MENADPFSDQNIHETMAGFEKLNQTLNVNAARMKANNIVGVSFGYAAGGAGGYVWNTAANYSLIEICDVCKQFQMLEADSINPHLTKMQKLRYLGESFNMLLALKAMMAEQVADLEEFTQLMGAQLKEMGYNYTQEKSEAFIFDRDNQPPNE